jgi:hypothetical protein
MFSAEIQVGRLMEIRLRSPVEPEEVVHFKRRVFALVQQSPRRVVGCTDLRLAHVFDQSVAEEIMGMMKTDNPRVERNAILVGKSAVFGMQIERMLKEVGSNTRRAFRDPELLRKWLDDVLDEEERRQVMDFLVALPTPDDSPAFF